MADSIQARLQSLYGPEKGRQCYGELARRLQVFRAENLPPTTAGQGDLSERDSIVITYGDMVQSPGSAPLATLADFLASRLGDAVSAVHVLPFFPSSSDDGFAVIDYRQVDPALGTWEDVERLAGHFKLMVDAVINHVSAQSTWFQKYRGGSEKHQDYFIEVDPATDLSAVARPRALPLLTPVQTARGERHVWTTFSTDQIDLNYANPDVLLEIIDLLLFYVAHGAAFVRLDAIAYLWKEVGTACIHLPQTHEIVQLFRSVLDEVAPHVKLITETNVPHADNVAYFGNGDNEAHLVYNFALPPLILHTFHIGSARALSEWASGLSLPSDRATFFNFLASHDGIGLNPVRGILPDAEIDALVKGVLAHGGLVSYKNNPDGSRSPYELNISLFDALSDPAGSEPLHTQVDRFMAAQAIMLALVGVPGIYFHSLFGSRGWPEGVRLTGYNRAINRQKLDRATLEAELADPHSPRSQVFRRTLRLLEARRGSPAFHPMGVQRVLNCGESAFGIARHSRDGEEAVYCLHNVSAQRRKVSLPTRLDRAENLLTGDLLSEVSMLELNPYEVSWLLVTG